MEHRRKSLNAKGFTLIEILVVIAVIGILVALAIMGMNTVFSGRQRDQTKSTLNNLSGMFTEMDRLTTLKRQPPHMWTPGNALHQPADGPFDIWRDASPAVVGTQGLPSPGRVDEDSTPTRFTLASVKNTQLVMWMMSQVPEVKTMLAGIPPEQTVKLPNDGNSGAYDEGNTPILIDAWGNPIVFVPATGLRGVTLADAVDHIVTTTKVYKLTQLPDGTTVPGARPFFASAGPDGDFTKGDDNLYSFQN